MGIMMTKDTRIWMIFIRWNTTPPTETTRTALSQSRAEAMVKRVEGLDAEIKIRPFTSEEQQQYDDEAKKEWILENDEYYNEGSFAECPNMDPD